MAKFVISRSTNAQYYFTFHGDNGERMLLSEMYVTKQSAINGAGAAKAASPYDKNYSRLTANNNQPYFLLKAENGQVLGVSETYSSAYARDAAIDTMKRTAPSAPVVDNT